MIRALPALALLAALASLVLGAAGPARCASSPSPVMGPGGILDMHHRFFDALDAHDGAAARAFLDVDREERPVTLYLGEGGDAPITGRTRGPSGKALEQWNHQTGRGTRIVRHAIECPSADSSYAILEFERIQEFTDGSRRLRRFRSTSLVRHVDGEWKLFHWHVSPAEDDGQLVKG